jgi:hypothetical protein
VEPLRDAAGSIACVTRKADAHDGSLPGQQQVHEDDGNGAPQKEGEEAAIPA